MKTPRKILFLLSALLSLSQSSQAQVATTDDHRDGAAAISASSVAVGTPSAEAAREGSTTQDVDGVATLAPGQTSATLSFNHEASGIIRLPLSINGQGPFFFALDSGAAAIVLDEGLAHKLGLQPIGKHGTARGVGPAGVDSWRTNATLQIGDATLTNQPLMVMDFSSVKAVMGQDVCGSLGRNSSTILSSRLIRQNGR